MEKKETESIHGVSTLPEPKSLAFQEVTTESLNSHKKSDGGGTREAKALANRLDKEDKQAKKRSNGTITSSSLPGASVSQLPPAGKRSRQPFPHDKFGTSPLHSEEQKCEEQTIEAVGESSSPEDNSTPLLEASLVEDSKEEDRQPDIPLANIPLAEIVDNRPDPTPPKPSIGSRCLPVTRMANVLCCGVILVLVLSVVAAVALVTAFICKDGSCGTGGRNGTNSDITVTNGNNSMDHGSGLTDTQSPSISPSTEPSVSTSEVTLDASSLQSLGIDETFAGHVAFLQQRFTPGGELLMYGTPQWDALISVLDDLGPSLDPANPADRLVMTNVYSLRTLYFSTGGALWMHNENWFANNNTPCDANYPWFGVTCDTAGNVATLNLPGNDMMGTVPSELWALTALQILDLAQNSLFLDLPTILGSFLNLQILNLDDNFIGRTLPTQMGTLLSIREIRLSGNLFTGTIPTEIGNILTLEKFILSGNETTARETYIVGTIPTSIGNLQFLRECNLSNHMITGSLPTEMGRLKALEKLDLYHNELTSSIPSEFVEMYSLGTSESTMEESRLPAPPCHFQPLCGLTIIDIFRIYDNNITGVLPSGNVQHRHVGIGS